MANRYLVNYGNWNATNTSIWSTTPNGPSGASAPTIDDDVFFTNSYGSGGPSILPGAICKSVTFQINQQNISWNGNFLTVGSRKITVIAPPFISGTFTPPADWNNNDNNIYLFGGGGGGSGSNISGNNRAAGGGGGGGGCVVFTNQKLVGPVPYTIGAGGTAGAAGTGALRTAGTGGTTTWGILGSATGGTGGSSLATGTPTSTGGVGGTGTGTGGFVFAGGSGGVGSITTTGENTGSGGGGGAGGPNGVGGNGGNGITAFGTAGGGGGGGNGGGTNGGNATVGPLSTGAGGNNSLGLGGGASRSSTGNGNTGINGGGGGGGAGGGFRFGGPGGYGSDILGVRGGGGGSGGNSGSDNSNAISALYGGGGGGAGTSSDSTGFVGRAGAEGAIIIVYTPLPSTPTKKTLFITQTGTSSFTIPVDFGSISLVECIGAGGAGRFNSRGPGGGGGAYASSTLSEDMRPGLVLQAVVGLGGLPNISNSNLNGGPTTLSYFGYAYCRAFGGSGANSTTGGAGGIGGLGNGVFYNGGTGGAATSGNKGGGGGSAGPFGNGGVGGAGNGSSLSSSGGGGGGGAGGSANGGAGAAGLSSFRGGDGGVDGNGNPGGLGAVNSPFAQATTPSNSGGGGGGGYGFNINPKAGGVLPVWTSVTGTTAGPAGGGGGGYYVNYSSEGRFGSGQGGTDSTFDERAGPGLIVFTYNVAAPATVTPYSVGQSGVANYVNTTSSAVTRVVANNGLGSYSPVVVGSGGAPSLTVTLSANQANVVINVIEIAGYKTSISNITIIVNAGVNIYSTVSTLPALFIYGANPGDTVTLINNGNIIGYGGNGGFAAIPGGGSFGEVRIPEAGGPAISTRSDIIVVNNGSIGGGGGGGGGAFDNGGLGLGEGSVGGGGGAGGGYGSSRYLFGPGRTISFTNPGPNGLYLNYDPCCSSYQMWGGGDGGYIIPTPTGGTLGTVTGSVVGIGANAGGSGAVINTGTYTPGNDGGGTGSAPTPNITSVIIGGGGGGFGGTGANGYLNSSFAQFGAVGGFAIVKNGKTVVIASGASQIYGTQA
jgi:hypothetical protein